MIRYFSELGFNHRSSIALKEEAVSLKNSFSFD